MNFPFTLKKHDWFLNGAVIFLAAASLTMLYSIAPDFFWRQLIWFAAAFAAILLVSQIDWRPLANARWAIFLIYFSAVALLVATAFFAPAIRQARSWLVVGPIQIQTAEIAKAALIIMFAYFFAKRHIGIGRIGILFQSFTYFLIPGVLVLLQPDLGSMLILLGIWLGFLFVSGIRWRHVLIGILIFSVLAGAGWQFFLRDYQKERIRGLFNPEYDPLGVNYSVIQSKIAVGSGGFWGKGFRQGTQVQLGFLPEAHSDFIFSAFIEEWGLLGGLAVIAAFLLVMIRIIRTGLFCKNNFSKLICLGTVIMFLLQFSINVGSSLGIFPVVGVSFPFFSYGGSNLLTNAVMIGIIQSIVSRSSFLA